MECEVLLLGNEHVPENPDPAWVSRHVEQARYSLQVVKCLDPDCCEPFISDWLTVLFIPPPVLYQYIKYGMTTIEPTECFANPLKYECAPLARGLLLKKSPESTDDIYFLFDLYCPSWKGSYWKVSAVNVDITGPVKLWRKGTR